jgi:DNA-directed RNA polymerase specialized sigma24 family protein
MSDDSRDPPGPQVFGLCNGGIDQFPSEPEGPARAPCRVSDADRAARVLDAQRPLVGGELRRGSVPERDVPDLVQTVLLHVMPWWMARWLAPEPHAEGELAAYLRVAARRAARHYCESRNRCPELLESEAEQRFAMDEPDPAPTPEEALQAAQKKRQRADFLNPQSLSKILGRPLWHIFLEYAVLGNPVKWIADRNQVPVPTIYNRIRIARDLLRAEVRRRRAALRAK